MNVYIVDTFLKLYMTTGKVNRSGVTAQSSIELLSADAYVRVFIQPPNDLACIPCIYVFCFSTLIIMIKLIMRLPVYMPRYM